MKTYLELFELESKVKEGESLAIKLKKEVANADEAKAIVGAEVTKLGTAVGKRRIHFCYHEGNPSLNKPCMVEEI